MQACTWAITVTTVALSDCKNSESIEGVASASLIIDVSARKIFRDTNFVCQSLEFVSILCPFLLVHSDEHAT